MKIVVAGLILLAAGLHAQIQIPVKSIFYNLAIGDSVTVYQCHVEQASQQIRTASGDTISSAPQEMSITDKFVIHKKQSGWEIIHYCTTLNILPNRKFSGLKLRERPYWNFKQSGKAALTDKQMLVLVSLEENGRETLEYDFTISKYTRNQVIFKCGKKFRQLLPADNIVLMHVPGFFQP